MTRMASTAALAMAVLGSFAGSAGADVQGHPHAGAPAVSATAQELSAGALTRNPLLRRRKPEGKRFNEDLLTTPVEQARIKVERGGLGAKEGNPASPARADGSVRKSRLSPRVSFTGPQSFDGPQLPDAGAFPPDTQGDIGPTQYIVMINGRVRSYNRDTGVADGALNLDADDFWDPVMTPVAGAITGNFTSDPHIRYDRLTDRWIAVIIDVPITLAGPGTAKNRILVATSTAGTITPTTVWNFHFIDTGVATEFADYPTLGVDPNALYIGVNNFPTAGGSYAGSALYVIRKSSVLGSGPIVSTKFPSVTTGGGAGPFTPQGVDNANPAATEGWFVGVDNALFGKLDFHKVTDPGGTPVLGPRIELTVPATQFPISVPHLGNTGGTNGNLDALDDRLYAATMRGTRIWTAHNIGVNTSGAASNAAGRRTASRWYELDVSGATPTLAQSGTVFDSAVTNPAHHWIPTIDVNGQGIAAIGGTVAGASRRVDSWFSGRLPGDAAGTVDPITAYTATTFAYNPPGDPGGTSGRRWGDYSFMSVDPLDNMTMWTVQEYVRSANTWGTRVVRLQAPPPAAPVSAAPATVFGGAQSFELTVTGTSSAGSGFYDPGATFPRRPAAALTSCPGATVNGLTVTNPTTLKLDLTTTGATNSSCGLTFTNPDGQAVSASGLFTLTSNNGPATAADAYAVTAGQTLNGTSVLANDSDADGDPLSASVAANPAGGALGLAANGTFTYTPNAGFVGTDTFTYRASDGKVQSLPVTASITVNPAPVVTPPPKVVVTPVPTVVPAKKQCVVPKLSKLTLKKARAKLKKAGCKTGKVSKVKRPKKFKKGRVVSSSPKAGTKRALNTKIKLKISR